jgi:hypothetical protein
MLSSFADQHVRHTFALLDLFFETTPHPVNITFQLPDSIISLARHLIQKMSKESLLSNQEQLSEKKAKRLLPKLAKLMRAEA